MRIQRKFDPNSACKLSEISVCQIPGTFTVVPKSSCGSSNGIYDPFRWYFRGVKYHRNIRKAPSEQVEGTSGTTLKWRINNNKATSFPQYLILKSILISPVIFGIAFVQRCFDTGGIIFIPPISLPYHSRHPHVDFVIRHGVSLSAETSICLY